MVSGKLFSLDDKDSFLGFGIEFVNQKDNYSTGKLPLSLEGKFSTNLYDGVWNINVYDGDELVEIDIPAAPNQKLWITDDVAALTANDLMLTSFLDDTFTAEEYATYILYADGLDEHGNFDPSRIDGLMTKEEAQRINKVFEKLNTNPDTYYEKKEIMAELKSIHDELVQKSQAKEMENQAKAEEEEKNKTFLQKLCAFFGL